MGRLAGALRRYVALCMADNLCSDIYSNEILL
jgi:hypothetical protein